MRRCSIWRWAAVGLRIETTYESPATFSRTRKRPASTHPGRNPRCCASRCSAVSRDIPPWNHRWSDRHLVLRLPGEEGSDGGGEGPTSGAGRLGGSGGRRVDVTGSEFDRGGMTSNCWCSGRLDVVGLSNS